MKADNSLHRNKPSAARGESLAAPGKIFPEAAEMTLKQEKEAL
jgi:hypothetical protein